MLSTLTALGCAFTRLPRHSRLKLLISRQATTLELLNNKHPYNNVPSSIISKVGINLHRKQHHPLNIIKNKIEHYCNNSEEYHKDSNQKIQFEVFDNLDPIVTTEQCFDVLRVPKGILSIIKLTFCHGI